MNITESMGSLHRDLACNAYDLSPEIIRDRLRSAAPNTDWVEPWARVVQLSWRMAADQACAWTDGLLILERTVVGNQKRCHIRLQQGGSPVLQRWSDAAGCAVVAYESFSKATRHVMGFASNRYSVAAVQSVHQVGRAFQPRRCSRR